MVENGQNPTDKVPLACILINYRFPDYTITCLESLLKSGMGDIKVFLVNNFSSDGSGNILKGFMLKAGIKFSYIEPENNLGFAGGVNLGIRAAMAEAIPHIFLLNNDTIVAENFIVCILESIKKHPGDVLAGRVLDYTSGHPSYNIGNFSSWTGQVRHILSEIVPDKIQFVSGCLMIVPIAVFKRIGLFDEGHFMYCEDMEFCLRLMKSGIRIQYCPSITIRHRKSSTAQRTETPIQYYLIRNRTHLILNDGTPLQKILFLALLAGSLIYKAVWQHSLFSQTARGAWHGVLGLRGKQHEEKIF